MTPATHTPLIIIEGTPTPDNRRLLIEIDDLRIPRSGRTFSMFTILALGRRIGTGWVLAPALIMPQDLVPRYMYRLRREIERACPEGHDLRCWPVYETASLYSGGSFYRMLTTPEQVIVSNPSALKEFGHHGILGLLMPDELERITV